MRAFESSNLRPQIGSSASDGSDYISGTLPLDDMSGLIEAASCEQPAAGNMVKGSFRLEVAYQRTCE